MTSKRSGIYNWERFSKPRVYSSSQRLTKDDDIQDWIKKVEDASSKAAAVAFGKKHVPSYHSTKAAISTTVEDVHLHDAAYAEAQELLEQWVAEKVDLDDDSDFTEETWTKKTQAEIRREWDHLLDPDEERGDVIVEDVLNQPSINNDPYSILEKDDSSIVDDVMQRLLDKQVLGADVLDDLGLDYKDSNWKDPRTKMKLRHQQVKENREKREHERKKKLKELQAKKDAYFQAKQLIKKEDHFKALQKKREEEAIQKEMANIRKEMEEAKKRQREQKLREQKEREQFEHCVEEEVNQQDEELGSEEKRRHLEKEYRRQLIMERLQEMQTKEALDNLKLLQKCFSSWYNLVLQRHLQIGKAKAMADWKLVLKTFNAWKSYTRSKHLEKEAILHETEIKILQRKRLLSEQHYRSRLMRKCFLSWQLYILGQRHKKYLNSQQDQTKNKMAAFLEAASSGRLWSSRSGGESQMSTGCTDDRSTSQKVAKLFDGNGRHMVPPGVDVSETDRTFSGRRRTNSGPHQLQAWQITRKHIQITKDDLAKVKDKNKSMEVGETSNVKMPKSRKVVTVGNYEHRHQAQQKILEMQQKQIKEQQRLIEEMQYLQKQQMLQQQLTQQQVMKQKSGWVQPGSKSTVVEQVLIPKPGEYQGDDRLTVVTDLKIEDLEGFNETDSNAVREPRVYNENTSRSDNASTASSTRTKVSSNNRNVNFLKTMEERAHQRAQLKREREEKRRQVEEARMRALQAEEEKRHKEEEEEKKGRAEAYREKKRLERQKELEKKKQLDHMKQLTDLAERQNRIIVMKYRGWLPWRHLVTMAKDSMEHARRHYENELLRKALLKWHTFVKEKLAHSKALADDMFSYILLRRCFNNWKKVGNYMIIQEERARRHFEMTLKMKIVRVWADYAMEEKMAMWKKERLAKEHNAKRVVLTVLRAWRRYPRLIREEKERQHRLEKMRKKVSSLLPDFDGVSLSQVSTESGS